MLPSPFSVTVQPTASYTGSWQEKTLQGTYFQITIATAPLWPLLCLEVESVERRATEEKTVQLETVHCSANGGYLGQNGTLHPCTVYKTRRKHAVQHFTSRILFTGMMKQEMHVFVHSGTYRGTTYCFLQWMLGSRKGVQDPCMTPHCPKSGPVVLFHPYSATKMYGG